MDRPEPAAGSTAKRSPSNGLSHTFRDTMALMCTSVAVITALQDGLPYGTTVSTFASLSMNPPMVLVSLDRNSQLLTVVREVGRLGVNILASTQADLAGTFATKSGTDKFDGISWHEDSNVPRLFDIAGFLSCAVDRLVEGGDHVIVLGTVLAADHAFESPLTYHRRAFGTHTVFGDQVG